MLLHHRRIFCCLAEPLVKIQQSYGASIYTSAYHVEQKRYNDHAHDKDANFNYGLVDRIQVLKTTTQLKSKKELSVNLKQEPSL